MTVIVPTAESVAVTVQEPAATGLTTPGLVIVQVFGVVLVQVLAAVTLEVVELLYVAVAVSTPSEPPTVNKLAPVIAMDEIVTGGGGGGGVTEPPHPGVTSPAGNPAIKAPSLQSHCGKVELATLEINGSWYP